jgi:hypothetical protein
LSTAGRKTSAWPHHAIRLVQLGELVDHEPINQAENGRVGANAERQREDACDGEAR